MELHSESEVLVVGAGPVGMTTAAFLAHQGIGVQIVEQGPGPAARSYALALHPGSLEILHELGLAEALVEIGKTVDSVCFYERGARRAQLSFAELDSEFPFVVVLAQSVLEKVLAQYLAAKQIEVLWNHRGIGFHLALDRVAADVEKVTDDAAGYGALHRRIALHDLLHTRSSFVVGADGFGSAVRRALDLEYCDLGGGQTFGVFEFEASWDAQRELCVVLDSRSTNALWPLGDRRFRWSFELTATERNSPRLKRRLLMQMGEEAFPYIAQELLEDLIAERAPWFGAPVRNVSWSVAVKFDRRLVPRFGRDGVWLVGDAAHLTGPVGVHSMNVGLREARDLARRLHAILRRDASPRLLEGYNEERLAEWRSLFGRGGRRRQVGDGQRLAHPGDDPGLRQGAPAAGGADRTYSSSSSIPMTWKPLST